jgi:amino acid transporter
VPVELGPDGAESAREGVLPVSRDTGEDIARHYEPQLKRSFGAVGNAILTLSAMSPATTVFVYVSVLLFMVGTWSFPATIMAAFIAAGMGLVYAELGTAYPIAGGEYAIIGRVLGRGTGFVVFVILLLFYTLLIASFALGAGIQLQTIWSTIDPRMAGLILLVLAAGLAVLRVRTSWIVTTVMLALELVSIGIVSVMGFAHAHDPVGRLLVPKAFVPSGAAAPITWSVLLVGLTLAFFNMTGFNVSVLFSEETKKARQHIGRAVLLAVAVFVVIVTVPTAAALLGAPSLRKLSTDPAAMTNLVSSLGAGRLGTFITLAIVVAIFNALVANIMGFGRVLWSGARDQVLPQPVNGWLEAVHPRYCTPWVACIVMAAAGAFSLFSSAITGLVTLMGVITLVFMSLMCVAALRIRLMRDAPRRYLMPLWPFVPIAVLTSFALMATSQTAKDVLIVLVTAVTATIYYLAYLRPRSRTKWVMLGAVEEPGEWVRATPEGAALGTTAERVEG